MSEFSPQDKQPSRAPAETAYHWNYSAQLEHDRALEQKQRRRGGAVYAIIMASAFLLCLAVLAGVLIWYQGAESTHAGAGDLSATIGSVSDAVKPATVLIYAPNELGVGYGTGFFLRDDGYIATNYHVVEGATSLTVRLYSGKEVSAEFVAGSAPDDLAIIKIKGAGYPVVSIGNSDGIKVGDLAIAIGNPGGEDGSWTTTAGIISVTNRTVAVSGLGYSAEVNMMQTDAPVSGGNSGGPLCNANGEVIGIVSRKLSDHEGIGLAIPINEAIASLAAMIDGTYRQSESTVAKVRPAIGITAANITAGNTLRYQNKTYTVPYDGVYVDGVIAGSPADGKLMMYDVIYAIDGKAASNITTLKAILDSHKLGDTITLSVFRLGETLEIKIKLTISE